VLGHLPERLVHRVADHLLAVIRVGPQEPAAHPELFAGEAHLVDRQLDRLHRQHRDAEQPLGVRLAVIGQPAVVGAAHRGGKARVLDGAREQAETGIEEGGVDAVGIHVHEGRERLPDRRRVEACPLRGSASWCYFAAAWNAGSLPMSRMSCWMTMVALRFAAICFMRSIEAIVAARSKLKLGTPLLS